MSFTIIPAVSCIKLIYSVSNIKAASRLREALCRATQNDREKLLVLMGQESHNCADLTVYIFDAREDVRIESLIDKPKTVKLFTPDKLPPNTATELAEYILTQKFNFII